MFQAFLAETEQCISHKQLWILAVVVSPATHGKSVIFSANYNPTLFFIDKNRIVYMALVVPGLPEGVSPIEKGKSLIMTINCNWLLH